MLVAKFHYIIIILFLCLIALHLITWMSRFYYFMALFLCVIVFVFILI